MILPTRVIAPLEQRSTEEWHQLREPRMHARAVQALVVVFPEHLPVAPDRLGQRDRKSTRLNSSHSSISYAVFCLKKKKKKKTQYIHITSQNKKNNITKSVNNPT